MNEREEQARKDAEIAKRKRKQEDAKKWEGECLHPACPGRPIGAYPDQIQQETAHPERKEHSAEGAADVTAPGASASAPAVAAIARPILCFCERTVADTHVSPRYPNLVHYLTATLTFTQYREPRGACRRLARLQQADDGAQGQEGQEEPARSGIALATLAQPASDTRVLTLP